jgi:hypothetical protein
MYGPDDIVTILYDKATDADRLEMAADLATVEVEAILVHLDPANRHRAVAGLVERLTIRYPGAMTAAGNLLNTPSQKET